MIKRALKKVLVHRSEYYHHRLLKRTSPKKLLELFSALGITKGDVVFVQSSLSQLGYLTQGPESVMNVLNDLVGSTGTIVMPSFSIDGSMQDYIESHPVFHQTHSPSRSGKLTECFRNSKGVLRSLHPTHSVCALGRHARCITEGHEHSISPCDDKSPFEKMAQLNTKLIRLGTGSNTFYHYVQEKVNFPNLFLDDMVTLECFDKANRAYQVKTKVYRKQLCNILFLRSKTNLGQTFSIHPSNYPVLYCGEREQVLRSQGSQELLETLLSVRQELKQQHAYYAYRLHDTWCESVNLAHYNELATKYFSAALSDAQSLYDLESLQRQFEAGQFPAKT